MPGRPCQLISPAQAVLDDQAFGHGQVIRAQPITSRSEEPAFAAAVKDAGDRDYLTILGSRRAGSGSLLCGDDRQLRSFLMPKSPGAQAQRDPVSSPGMAQARRAARGTRVTGAISSDSSQLQPM
jgi:hypothetical protein